MTYQKLRFRVYLGLTLAGAAISAFMFFAFLQMDREVLVEGKQDLSAIVGAADQVPGAALYYGYNCAGATTNTCGIGSNFTSGLSTLTTGQSFTMGSHAGGYTVRTCGVYIGAKAASPNDKYRCAVYTVSGSTATLVTHCAQTADSTFGTVPGWSISSMNSGCILAASTAYLVFVEVNSNTTTIANETSGGTSNFFKSPWTYGTFTTPITSLSSNAGVVSALVGVTAN